MLTVINDDTEQRMYVDEEGKEYLSVSAICRELTGRDPFAHVEAATLEESIRFGKQVHWIFATYCAFLKGLCESPDVDPKDWAAMNAYLGIRKWVADTKYQPVLIESPAVNRPHRFAGCPDGKGWHTTGRHKPIMTIPDLKTGTKQPESKLQVRLYRFLEGYTDARKVLLLYIDGETPDYQEIPVECDPGDEIALISTANLMNWRKDKGY